MDPSHGPPLQARVAAANGTVLQLANMLVLLWTILAHMEWNRGKRSKMNGAKQLNGGKLLRRAVGMAGKDGTAGNKKPAEQQLQANTAGGLSARHRP